MQEKRRLMISGGGAALILMTFLVLCLVSFASLAVVSAKADERLSEKFRAQVSDYYRARNQAETFLSALSAAAEGTAPIPQASAFGAVEIPSENAAPGRMAFLFPVNETQELLLTVDLIPEFSVVDLKSRMSTTLDYSTPLPVLKR